MNISLHNISVEHGAAISITGMLIVFLALAFISAFLETLPYILRQISKILPEEVDEQSGAGSNAIDEGMVAAVGYILKKNLTDSK